MHLFLQFIFGIKLLHVLDSSSVHHQEFFTLHTELVYVIQVCWQLASRIRTEPVPSWSCSQAVWRIPLLRVQWKTPDDGQRNCPKHVEFYSRNKFEKLMHIVGFIIRIYHDARSPERQNLLYFMLVYNYYGSKSLTNLHFFHQNILLVTL